MRAWLVGILTLGLAACDAGAPPAEVPAAPERVTAGFGTITGRVVLSEDADVPAPIAVSLASDPGCEAAWKGETLYDPAFVVNDDRSVPHTMLAVTGVRPDAPRPRGEPARLVMARCTFTPHVIGTVVGDVVEVDCRDAVCRSFLMKPRRNAPVYARIDFGVTERLVLREPEDAIPVICDVHSWKSGWLFVFDHPWFATSGIDDGRFTIENVPAGTHTLRVWHETFERDHAEVRITVRKDETTEIEVALSGR